MISADEKFMQKALILGKKGGRAVAPNPMVGAVIVQNGKVIGQGYHQVFGGPHAEVNAIQSVKNRDALKGSTLYVTLEPCRHHGKTPPCLDLIQSVGIERVVVGSGDPFQENYELRMKNYELEYLQGSIAEQCRELNKFFFTWVENKRPFITVKIAVSADEFVAGFNGKPIHITSLAQDKKVHRLRAQHQAIMVGTNTVLNDDPQLNVRHVVGPNPLKVILDRELKIPIRAKVFKDSNVLLVTKKWTSSTTCPKFVQNKLKCLNKNKIQVLECSQKNHQIDLKYLFKALAKKGIASVLVEPGPTLYSSLKTLHLIDDLIIFRGHKKLREGLRIEL